MTNVTLYRSFKRQSLHQCLLVLVEVLKIQCTTKTRHNKPEDRKVLIYAQIKTNKIKTLYHLVRNGSGLTIAHGTHTDPSHNFHSMPVVING